MPPPFVARFSRWRSLLIVAMGCGFIALSLCVAGAFGDPHLGRSQDLNLLFGSAGVLGFGLGALSWLKKLVLGGDAITVDSRGVLARQWSDDLIPWTSIVAIERRKLRSKGLPIGSILTLELADAEKYPAKRLSWLGKLSRFWRLGDVSFNSVGTDKSFGEVADALERHWQHYRGSIPASKSS